MKLRWKRLAAVMLTAALVLALLPFTQVGSALAAGTYGRTTATDVAVRKEASTSSAFWFRVEQGTVATVLSTKTVKGVTWYRVVLKNPAYEHSNTYYGYIHGGYFELLTEAEAVAWESNPLCVKGTAEITAVPGTSTVPTAVPVPTAVTGPVTTAHAAPSGTIGVIKNSGVNIRQEPSMSSYRLFQVDRGTEVYILEIPASYDPDPWYKVSYLNVTGYIMAQFVTVNGVSFATPTPTVTAAPAAVVTPTPAPAGTVTAAPATAAPAGGTGEYVRLLLASTLLYYTPNGASMVTWNSIGSTLPLAGNATVVAGFVWYPVYYNGTVAYVRGDAVQRTGTAGNQPVVTAAPAGTVTAAPASQTVLGYVITTKGGVNLRLKPAGELIQQLTRGTVCPLLAAPTAEAGYDWYYVQVNNVRGYLRGDCVAYCNADGSLVTGTGTPAPATVAPAVTTGYVKTIADKVNLRKDPGGSTQEQIPLNVILPLTGTPRTSGNYTWYPVRAASGRTGWLRGDCVVLTDVNGVETVTPAPAVTVTPTPASGYGYIQVIKPDTNFRRVPAGAAIGQLQKGSVWPMTGTVVRESGYDWYPVEANGKTGYLRGDCVQKLSDTQVASYLAGNGVPVETPTPAPTPTPPPVYVVQTVLDKVYLRKNASRDSQALSQVALGTVMTYSAKTTAGGNTWYNISYGDTTAWVLGTCVKELTAAEYAAFLAANPQITAAPAASSTQGYIKTIKGGVNVRPSPGSSRTLGQVARNLVFAYSATSTTNSGRYTWYKVTTTHGEGWLRGDCVELCQADGSLVPATIITPSTTSGTGTGVTVNTSAVEASYTILKLGSTGEKVRKLVQALKDQGYYAGNVTSTYTEEVQAAVSAFQSAKGLMVDGIAGSQTQHALFGTVPVGTYDGSDMSMVLYPAEKIDWFTGGIQELWPRGANLKVYDVKTGIVWWAHRWAGAYHADIEPLTAADTARLCAIYGVTKPKEIETKNLYQRRPSLITIGTHTYACALYGVPHNYGAGDISTNNWPGQICMHFTNSKTHGSKIVYYLNTQAIQYAWENAPNGHK